MKPYGHSRKDKIECDHGCCTLKSGKKKNCRKVVDKTNRKTARKEAKEAKEAKEEISSQGELS